MRFILNLSSLVLISFFMISCGQDEAKEKQTTTDQNLTNSTDNSLTITPTVTTTPSGALKDIWVLDSINNKTPDSNQFAHGTPYFDIDSDSGTIKGHTGCNGINGKLKVTGEKLNFDSLVVDKNNCKDKSFEKKLLKAFHEGNLGYEISNDKLYLNIEPGTVYTFRRIRR